MDSRASSRITVSNSFVPADLVNILSNLLLLVKGAGVLARPPCYMLQLALTAVKELAAPDLDRLSPTATCTGSGFQRCAV